MPTHYEKKRSLVKRAQSSDSAPACAKDGRKMIARKRRVGRSISVRKDGCVVAVLRPGEGGAARQFTNQRCISERDSASHVPPRPHPAGKPAPSPAYSYDEL